MAKNHKKRRFGPPKKHKKSQKPFLLKSMATLMVIGGAGYGAYSFLSTPSDPSPTTEKAPPSKAWYLQQADAPEMVRLADTPLILAPDEAEIDETIEIVSPLPQQSPTPIVEPEEVLESISRLDNVEVATKPTPPVVIYEEPLSDEIHSPKPTIRKPQPKDQILVENPNVVPVLEQPTFEETFETAAIKPRWAQHAIEFNGKIDRPMIAVVIDDLGLDRRRTRQTLNLTPPMTMAFIPYAKNLERQTQKARTQGHELMLHLPMEPLNAKIDAGPNHLNTKLNQNGLNERLHWNLNRFDGYVGVNNHMGSRATTDLELMKTVMTELRNREMLFLDSRTNPESVGAQVAKEIGVPVVERNVFLDNENTVESVLKQLSILEKVSRKRGYAIGIGHPRDATIAALKQWLPSLEAKGFSLVPISQIILQQEARL